MILIRPTFMNKNILFQRRNGCQFLKEIWWDKMIRLPLSHNRKQQKFMTMSYTWFRWLVVLVYTIIVTFCLLDRCSWFPSLREKSKFTHGEKVKPCRMGTCLQESESKGTNSTFFFPTMLNKPRAINRSA